jgi:hypothetical protein
MAHIIAAFNVIVTHKPMMGIKAGHLARTRKRKGSTALNKKQSSNTNSQGKASSTGKRKASTALNEKPSSNSNPQARASSTGKSKGSAALDTMMSSNSNSQAIHWKKMRATSTGKNGQHSFDQESRSP